MNIFRNSQKLICFVVITECSAINDFTTPQHVLSQSVNSEVKRTCDIEASYQFKICISRPLLLSASHRGIYERLNGKVCLFALSWYQLTFLSGKKGLRKSFRRKAAESSIKVNWIVTEMCLAFSTFQSLKGRWKSYLTHNSKSKMWVFFLCISPHVKHTWNYVSLM